MAAPLRSRSYLAPRPLIQPRWRLICFAHAGAGASAFHPWAALLAEAGVELRAAQYPGRENRWGEPLITTVAAMAADWAEKWEELVGPDEVPVAVYGHSMGALVAYELARRVPATGKPLRHLLLGGRNPPHVPSSRSAIHHLPDDEFMQQVAQRYGNLPAALLADPDMKALLIPVLKADFALVDTYRGELPERPSLAVPLTVLNGRQDPFTDRDQLTDWARYTTGASAVRELEGGHFFHQQRAAEAVQLVRQLLG